MNGVAADRKLRARNGRVPYGLIAAKVIMRGPYSGVAKSVGAWLLEHMNWTDFRCDPGIETLAALSGHARSSVQEAICQLKQDGILRVVVHGGKGKRNAHEFDWDEIFRRDEAAQAALKARRRSPGKAGVARPEKRAQTRIKNPCSEPEGSDCVERGAGGQARSAHPGWSAPQQSSALRRSRRSRPGQQRSEAAVEAAKQRWFQDLRHRLRDDKEAFVTMVAAIDAEIENKATEAEMRRRGAGVITITEILGARYVSTPLGGIGTLAESSNRTGLGNRSQKPETKSEKPTSGSVLEDSRRGAEDDHGSSQAPSPFAVVSNPEVTPVSPAKPGLTKVDEVDDGDLG
jgi:hypothetical protein